MDKLIDLRDAVEAAAERLGAKRETVFKWRQRGIPSDWKLRIIADPKTSFSVDDLERVESIGVRRRDIASPFTRESA